MASAPTVGGMLTAVFIFFISFFAVVVFNINHMRMEELWGVYAIWLIAFAVLIVILVILNHYVVKKYITAPFLKDDEIALVFYTGKGNEIIFYDKPIWGKFPFSIVRMPKGWKIDMMDNFAGRIEFKLKIRTSQDRVVTIPVKIRFDFIGPFEPQDFRRLLPLQWSPKIISLEDEIKEFFFEFAKSESTWNNPVKDSETEMFLRQDLSEKDYMKFISSEIDFPKMFSNAKKPIPKFGRPLIGYVISTNAKKQEP